MSQPSPVPAAKGAEYAVALPSFEGPLDLLLHLCQKHELDILEIPIGFVTEKYLEYLAVMQLMQLDIASEYLVMAATLAHIKSKMLLPAPPPGQEDDALEGEDEGDPREALIRRLLEYQKYKQAGADLAARGVAGRDVFLRGGGAGAPEPTGLAADAPPPGLAPLAEVPLFAIVEAFQRVLERSKVKLSHEVVTERVSLNDRIQELADLLQSKKRVAFAELFDGLSAPIDLVITFLALLEMTRLRMTQLFQTEPLAPLYVQIADAAPPDVADESAEGAQPIENKEENAILTEETNEPVSDAEVSRQHLKGLIEALVFVSDRPVKAGDLAKAAAADAKLVRELLAELQGEYRPRGVQLDEVAGGWAFRTSAAYAPFVRDLATQKPVRLTRAQIETLAIVAYRQPITRPETDDIRGVDCGPVLKLLLERDLVRILGRKDEPGRPVLYGTTTAFLELFGLKSLKDLPTLREFTDLNEDSRRVFDREVGEEGAASAEPGAPTDRDPEPDREPDRDPDPDPDREPDPDPDPDREPDPDPDPEPDREPDRDPDPDPDREPDPDPDPDRDPDPDPDPDRAQSSAGSE